MQQIRPNFSLLLKKEDHQEPLFTDYRCQNPSRLSKKNKNTTHHLFNDLLTSGLPKQNPLCIKFCRQRLGLRRTLRLLILVFLVADHILLVLLAGLVVVFRLPFARRLAFLQETRSIFKRGGP